MYMAKVCKGTNNISTNTPHTEAVSSLPDEVYGSRFRTATGVNCHSVNPEDWNASISSLFYEGNLCCSPSLRPPGIHPHLCGLTFWMPGCLLAPFWGEYWALFQEWEPALGRFNKEWLDLERSEDWESVSDKFCWITNYLQAKYLKTASICFNSLDIPHMRYLHYDMHS